MVWVPPVDDPEDKKGRCWNSNQEILEAWRDESLAFGKKNPLKKYPAYAGFFREIVDAKWPGKLLLDLDVREIEAVMAAIGTKCSKLQRRNRNGHPACQMGLAIAGCPAVNGDDLTSCPKYRPLQVSGVKSYYIAVGNMYAWLHLEGYIMHNPMKICTARWVKKNKDWLEKRRRDPVRRALTQPELEKLIMGLPIRLGIVVALCTLCFLRIHEAMKLSVDPKHFDLDGLRIKIPDDPAYGNKRLGNDWCVIAPPLLAILRRYLQWREEHVKRDEDGNELTDKLVLTPLGLPWCPDGFQENFNKAVQKHAVRLGIQAGQKAPKDEQVNSHCYRAFAVTWAFEQGANELQVKVLKGDRPPGALQEYIHVARGLGDLYNRYAPKLAIR